MTSSHRANSGLRASRAHPKRRPPTRTPPPRPGTTTGLCATVCCSSSTPPCATIKLRRQTSRKRSRGIRPLRASCGTARRHVARVLRFSRRDTADTKAICTFARDSWYRAGLPGARAVSVVGTSQLTSMSLDVVRWFVDQAEDLEGELALRFLHLAHWLEPEDADILAKLRSA